MSNLDWHFNRPRLFFESCYCSLRVKPFRIPISSCCISKNISCILKYVFSEKSGRVNQQLTFSIQMDQFVLNSQIFLSVQWSVDAHEERSASIECRIPMLGECTCRNSCELYSSLLISFTASTKQVVCDRDSSHKDICLCSIESMKIRERKISSDWLQKARLEITP